MRMATAPSPTAAATRFTDPCRTSPTANTLGRLVSNSHAGRPGRPTPGRSVPVRTYPARSRSISPATTRCAVPPVGCFFGGAELVAPLRGRHAERPAEPAGEGAWRGEAQQVADLGQGVLVGGEVALGQRGAGG